MAADTETLDAVGAGIDPREMRVLVTYATAHGSTRGVAERIARRLGETDLVETGPDLGAAGYDAVVLGSPVYNQSWLPDAQAFVDRNREALARIPVWLFSVGTFGDTKRLIGPLMKREPRGVRSVLNAVHPRDYRVFAGVIDRHQWPFLSRQFFHLFGGRLGDNRDWDQIDAWADEIAADLASD